MARARPPRRPKRTASGFLGMGRSVAQVILGGMKITLDTFSTYAILSAMEDHSTREADMHAKTEQAIMAQCRWCGPRRLMLDVQGGCVPVLWSPRMGVPPVWDRAPIKEAVGYIAWCLEHRQPLSNGKAIRVTITDGPCGADCRLATGSACRCSCGGLNHGMDA